MALAPGTSYGIKPPTPPAHPNLAQALAEHIAQMSMQTPAQVTPSAYVDSGAGAGENAASLASYNPTIPQYGRASDLINQFLTAEGSPLAGLGRVFTKKSRKYGIDPRLLVAIAGAETSLMKDPNAAPMSEHNAWGMGPGIQYSSWGQGAGATAKNLAENYFGQGLDTPEEISTKWAPIGATNDPNNVNQNWANNVGSYMKRLSNIVGKDQAMKLYPVLGNVNWTSLGGVSAHMSRPLGNWQSDNAIDLGAPVGTPVYAPAGGQLVGGFGDSSNGGTVWGRRLTLDPRKPGLPDWFMTHLGSYAPGVSAGDKIRRGDVLGYIGARDSAWSPHLHFGQEFGNPETTVEKNLYDPVSSVPAYRGTAGASGAFSAPATPNQQGYIDAAQQQQQGAAGSIFAAADADYPNFRRKRRGGDTTIDQLIQALLAGQAGQSLMV